MAPLSITAAVAGLIAFGVGRYHEAICRRSKAAAADPHVAATDPRSALAGLAASGWAVMPSIGAVAAMLLLAPFTDGESGSALLALATVLAWTAAVRTGDNAWAPPSINVALLAMPGAFVLAQPFVFPDLWAGMPYDGQSVPMVALFLPAAAYLLARRCRSDVIRSVPALPRPAPRDETFMGSLIRWSGPLGKWVGWGVQEPHVRAAAEYRSMTVGAHAIIDTAWDEYRAWAARAHELHKSSQLWNTLALVAAGAAAVLGAAALQTAAHPPIATALSLTAAIAAGAVPFLGKEILAIGSEAQLIRARATAEAIKSECYRYAARVGDYTGPDRNEIFLKRRAALIAEATKAGLSGKNVDPKDDPRKPPDPYDAAWYDKNCIFDLVVDSISNWQEQHETTAKRLRNLSFGASFAAAAFGIAGARYDAFAPWIGALTTISTAVAAQGLMGRYQQLAATYSAMLSGLKSIRDEVNEIGLHGLVTRIEDLMQSEHAAWVEHMTKTIPNRRRLRRHPRIASSRQARRVTSTDATRRILASVQEVCGLRNSALKDCTRRPRQRQSG